MESNRDYIVRKKPRVVLDKRFDFINELSVGDTGQLDADVIVEKITLEEDSRGDDMRLVGLKIIKAELLNNKTTRIL